MTDSGTGTGGDSNESAAGDVRIGDAERQAVVDMLSRHAAAGRLTLDEFAERAGHVFAARTRGDLLGVVGDLPSDLPGDATTSGGAAAGAEPSGLDPVTSAQGWGLDPSATEPSGRQRRKRRFTAIMSGASARGRWWAPRKIRAFAWWGGVTIDLREAVISSPVVHIKASAYMGHVLILVPEGIPVDMYGFVLMGGSSNRVGRAAPIQGAPLVRVKARGMWGGVTVQARKQLSPAEQMQRKAERAAAKAEKYASAHRDAKQWHHHQKQGRRDDSDWVAGELPPPSLHDALPLLDDIPGMAHAKGRLRDKLLAAAELFETEEPAAEPSTRDSQGTDGTTSAPSAAASSQAEPRRADDTDTATSRLPLGTMTILVTDIVGSTSLAGLLGDQRWMEVLRHHNELVREQVASNDGTEVKAQGDGFMMVFPSARKAILASVDIQRAMAKYRAEHPEHEVELRIGLHTGEVVTDDNDIHGQNVVTAVRIADAASPNEILVSGITRDLTVSAGDLRFDSEREIDLKGFEVHQRVHTVTWA